MGRPDIAKDGKQFTSENASEMGKRGGAAKKGSLHISTHIQNMLNDPEFTAEVIVSGKKTTFKGAPMKAIIKTAMLKSMSGDKQWAEWLAKYGYGQKVVHSNDPESPMGTPAEPTLVDQFIEFVKNDVDEKAKELDDNA